MSHTPGPWEVQSHGHDFWVDTPCDPPQHRQDICRMSFRMTDHKVSADNARLIAASPELLAALIDVSNAYQKMFDVMPAAWQTYDHIVNAAIAKATGQ